VDIDKIIGSPLEQQAKFDAWVASFKAGMEELRQNHQATERLINAFANDGAAQIELHRARLDSLERRVEADEQRFQAFSTLRRLPSGPARRRPRCLTLCPHRPNLTLRRPEKNSLRQKRQVAKTRAPRAH